MTEPHHAAALPAAQTSQPTSLISASAPRGAFLARFQRWEWMLVGLILLVVLLTAGSRPISWTR